MKPSRERLTLSAEARYEIKVLGYLDEHYSDWNQKIRIKFEDSSTSSSVTTIFCSVDQAGLLGILRRLYTLGLPLISVDWVGS